MLNRKLMIHLLDLRFFLSFSLEELKSSFLQCEFSSDALYSFSGRPLPPEAHSLLAQQLITRMVAAAAFPGPNEIFRLPGDGAEAAHRVLHLMVEDGSVGCRKRWN